MIEVGRGLWSGRDGAPAGIGLALAGLLDSPGGRVLEAPNLDLDETLIGPPVAAALDAPVRLVNDVNAAAWAEACEAEQSCSRP